MQTHAYRVIFISIISMLFTAISNADLGIISQFASQNGNSWIGSLSIAMIFLGSGIGSCYNGYINKWQYKYIIFAGALGWLGYLSFSVAFLFIGFSNYIIAVILVGSLICGFIVSVYYNGINNYVNECGKRDNRTSFYFGINICIIQSSNVIGNGISAVLIEPLGQKIYSFVMLGVVMIVVLLFLGLKEFRKDYGGSSLIERERSEVIGEQSELNEAMGESDVFDKIPKTFYFCFAFSGIMISFVYGELSLMFYNTFTQMGKQELNSLTFKTFMIQGCGQFIGGLFLVFLSSKLRSITTAYISNGFFFLLSIAVLWYGFAQKAIWIIEIGAFMTGLADCFGFALALSIGGRWNQSGISLFNFGQSFTVAILSVLNIFLTLPYLSGIYLLIQLLSSAVLLHYKRLINVTKSSPGSISD